MNRGHAKTILFAIMAIISIGSLVVIIASVGEVSYAQVPVEVEPILVELQDSISISDEIEVSQNG